MKEKKRPKAGAARRSRAAFSVTVPRPGKVDFVQVWKWRYARETDSNHRTAVSRAQYAALGQARSKHDLLLVDFLFFYARTIDHHAESARLRFTSIKREVYYSLLAADYDVLPEGFSSYADLRAYLREKFPGALVFTTPSRKAKILFLVNQDIAADRSELGPRWHALKGLLGEERLLVFDRKVIALHKVYFNQQMLDFWRENYQSLTLYGKVSELAERGGMRLDQGARRSPDAASEEENRESEYRVVQDGRGEDGPAEPRPAPAALRPLPVQRPDATKGFRRRLPVESEANKKDTRAHQAHLSTRSKSSKEGALRRTGSTGDELQSERLVDRGSIDEVIGAVLDPANLRESAQATVPRELRRFLGELPESLLLVGKGNSKYSGKRGGRSGFIDFLRILVASPRLADSSVLPQITLAGAVGVGQSMVNRYIAMLLAAKQLVVVDSNYAAGRKAKAYRASGELLSLVENYYRGMRIQKFKERLPPAETLQVADGAWNQRLFELTNAFGTQDEFLDYVTRIPGVNEKKSRIKQAKAAWRSHVARNKIKE